MSPRRVLICHTIVRDLMGSTIVTLDLATRLHDLGAEVLVYAAHVHDPAASLFTDRGIEVVDDLGLGERSLTDFDLVWVNSQVLPAALVDELGTVASDDLPAFVFLHMSALEQAPDEHPWIHGLEERLSSLSLFISPNTRRKLLPWYDEVPPTSLYPNPAPVEFAKRPHRRLDPSGPRNVLVVSNHADPALMAAKQVLIDRGVAVRHVGSTGEGQSFVTPELLDEHDLVVTIGKTVQYCLVTGTPVYVYDRFGGYGYLDADGFDHAQFRNFSGRGGRQLTPEQIADEIIGGYAAAVRFHVEGRDELVRTYSIDHVLERVLGEVERRTVEPFGTDHLHAIRSAEAFSARFYRYWGVKADETRWRRQLVDDVRRERQTVERLTARLEGSETARAELEAAHATTVRDLKKAGRRVRSRDAEIARLRGSWAYRVGRLVLRPLAALRRLVGR